MNFDNINSALSFQEHHNFVTAEMRAKVEQLNNLNQQTEEAKKQTTLLEETKEISHETVSYTHLVNLEIRVRGYSPQLKIKLRGK